MKEAVWAGVVEVLREVEHLLGLVMPPQLGINADSMAVGGFEIRIESAELFEDFQRSAELIQTTKPRPEGDGYITIARLQFERRPIGLRRVFPATQLFQNVTAVRMPGGVVGVDLQGNLNLGERFSPAKRFGQLLCPFDPLLSFKPVVHVPPDPPGEGYHPAAYILSLLSGSGNS